MSATADKLCTRAWWTKKLSYYETVKIVRVKERRLRLVQVLFTLIVILYVVIKVIIIDEAQYLNEVPTGNAHALFERDGNISVNYAKLRYCYGAYNENDPESTSPAWWREFSLEKLPCRTWDTITHTVSRLNTVFIPTMAREERDRYVCGAENTIDDLAKETACTNPYEATPNSRNEYFLAGAETFKLVLRHYFLSNLLKPHATSCRDACQGGYMSEYEGVLEDVNGKVIETFETGPGADRLSVPKLLEAAGVQLDRHMDSDADGSTHSLRYRGSVFGVSIYYTNRGSNDKVRYIYRVRRFQTPGFSDIVAVPDASDWRSDRLRIERVGMLFVFQVTGDIVKFHFQSLMIHILSAALLVKFATVLTDLVMLYVLRDRAEYRKAKYEDSQDFNELREAEEEQQERLIGRLNHELDELRASATTYISPAPSLAPRIGPYSDAGTIN